MARGENSIKPCGLDKTCPRKDNDTCKTEPRKACPLATDCATAMGLISEKIKEFIEDTNDFPELKDLSVYPKKINEEFEFWWCCYINLGCKDGEAQGKDLVSKKYQLYAAEHPNYSMKLLDFTLAFRCEDPYLVRQGASIAKSGNPHNIANCGKIQFAETKHKYGNEPTSTNVKNMAGDWVLSGEETHDKNCPSPGEVWPLEPNGRIFGKKPSELADDELNTVLEKLEELSNTTGKALLAKLAKEYGGCYFHVDDILDDRLDIKKRNQIIAIISRLFCNWAAAVRSLY